MKKILSGLVATGGLLVLTGCGSGSSGTALSSASPAATSTSLESLRSAPTGLTVGGTTYGLSATLFRNFQPTISPTGVTVSAPLNASFTVAGATASAIPAGLTVTSAYVVQNSTVGTFTNLSPTISTTINASSTLSVPSGSTNYAPGSVVEVVVQVQSADGTTYLLQDPSVTILSVE